MFNFAGFTHCWLSQLLCLMSHRLKILLSMDWFLLRESTFFFLLFRGYLVNNHSFGLFVCFFLFCCQHNFCIDLYDWQGWSKNEQEKKELS